MKYAYGDRIEDFEATDMRGATLRIPDPMHAFTHLMFRRWAGCPICSTHISTFAREKARLAAAGIRVVVVLASTAEEVADARLDAPFDFLPDPEERHYKAFGVGRSWLASFQLRPFVKGIGGILSGRADFRHVRRFDGLPADFLIRADGFVVDAYYGEDADDQLSIDELVAAAASLGGAVPG
jgi:hypothetical protein